MYRCSFRWFLRKKSQQKQVCQEIYFDPADLLPNFDRSLISRGANRWRQMNNLRTNGSDRKVKVIAKKPRLYAVAAFFSIYDLQFAYQMRQLLDRTIA